MRNLIALGVVVFTLAFSPAARAQLSPEEAKSKLAERDAQRQAERRQIIQITAGELADLRLRVSQLEAQVKSLRAQLADKQSPKKFHEVIEIGMTREEVIAFVKAHPKLQIIAMQADAGVSRTSHRTTLTKVESSRQDATVKRGGSEPERTMTDLEKAETSKAQAEIEISNGKREVIEIGRYQTYREQSGTQRDSLGGSHPVYENIERQDGRIGVTLIDGVVTAVDAR